MSAQPKERLHGDFAIQGYYKDDEGDGYVEASTEWTASSVTKRFFTAGRKYRIKGVRAVVTAAGTDGGGATATIFVVPDATAIASGNNILSGSINLQGTANTQQAMALTATSSFLDIDRGQTLAIQFTGTLTTASGGVTVSMTPL